MWTIFDMETGEIKAVVESDDPFVIGFMMLGLSEHCPGRKWVCDYSPKRE